MINSYRFKLGFFEYINEEFKVKRRVYDISYTYDGYCIVSLRFMEVCQREAFEGLEFIELPADKCFYYLRVKNVVEFDFVRRETLFEKKCASCGNYESVNGATPAYIKNSLPNDICRTDISFGSGNEKSPMILISENVKNVFDREKIKGLTVDSIYT